MMLPTR